MGLYRKKLSVTPPHIWAYIYVFNTLFRENTKVLYLPISALLMSCAAYIGAVCNCLRAAMHYLYAALIACYINYVLRRLHIALFAYCAAYMLYWLRIALLACCTACIVHCFRNGI